MPSLIVTLPVNRLVGLLVCVLPLLMSSNPGPDLVRPIEVPNTAVPPVLVAFALVAIVKCVASVMPVIFCTPFTKPVRFLTLSPTAKPAVVAVPVSVTMLLPLVRLAVVVPVIETGVSTIIEASRRFPSDAV